METGREVAISYTISKDVAAERESMIGFLALANRGPGFEYNVSGRLYRRLFQTAGPANALVRTVQQLRSAQAQTSQRAYSVSSTQITRQWGVGDRLGEADMNGS
jgi:hypothetical protein